MYSTAGGLSSAMCPDGADTMVSGMSTWGLSDQLAVMMDTRTLMADSARSFSATVSA